VDICPKPLRWKAIYERLLSACEGNAIASRPPVPLILSGWSYTNDAEKAERWKATKAWAEQNALSELITVPPEDWYSVEKPSSYPIGPLGRPTYLPWRFEPAPKPSADDVKAAFVRLIDKWAKIAGALSEYTRPSRITGRKRRRLLVTRLPSAPPPPWGDWGKLGGGDPRRRFTELRQAVNAAVAPLEIDHIDFEIEHIHEVGGCHCHGNCETARPSD